MTPAGHLAGGYLAGTALTALIPEAKPLAPWMIAAAMTGSVFPDIDLLYFLVRKRRIVLDASAAYHRTYPTHAPSVYGVAALALAPTLGAAGAATILVAAAFLIGIATHFVQDSFGVGPGIRWLWPFRKRFLRAPTAYRRDGSFKKNIFMRPSQYVRHWLCWVEAALVVVAIFIGR